jgi:hypothetical protein
VGVARKQGVAEVPCIVIDHLDKTEKRALSIALNRLGETGAWDPDALRLEFEELTVLGIDLIETGFESAEIMASCFSTTRRTSSPTTPRRHSCPRRLSRGSATEAEIALLTMMSKTSGS